MHYRILLTVFILCFSALSAQMTGTYSVGPGGDFTTLFATIQALNTQGVGAGGVIFELAEGHTFDEGNFYEAITVEGSETSPIVFRNSGTPGVNNPILTRTGVGTNTYGIRIDGGAYITFDGLDIHCTATSDIPRMEYGYWIDNGANHITVSNCSVELYPGNTEDTEGIKVGTYSTTDSGYMHDLSFVNNTIRGCYHGYWIAGNTGNMIDNLFIGTEGGGSHTIYFDEYPNQTYPVGIRLLCVVESIVTDIEITTEDPTTYYSDQKIQGFSCDSHCHDLEVSHLEIHDINCVSHIEGIEIYGYDSDIYCNRIYNMASSNNSTQPQVVGITNYAINEYYNNMIWGLAAPASRNNTYGAVIGIDIEWGVGHLYYNTIYLDYEIFSLGAQASYCVRLKGYGDLRNNILINNTSIDMLSSPAYSSIAVLGSAFADPTARLQATTNNNLYYAGTPDGVHNIFYYNSATEYQTLSEYQTAVDPIDNNTITEIPPFVSTTDPYNLHISPAAVTGIESGAFPVVGVTTDIDGDTRDFSHPDIGADEGDFLASGGGGGGTGTGGYYYASTIGGTVPFDWQLPVAPSEVLGLTDDSWSGWIALPFTFRFYGIDYDEFGINSNGMITLSSESDASYNLPIPYFAGASGFIAWFWDDLDPSNSAPGETSIQYGLNDDGNFVITFTRYPVKDADANGWITAQVVLYNDDSEDNDRILFQYEDRGSSMPLDSCTIGIESHSGIEGIQYHYNTTGGDIFTSDRAPVAIMFGDDDSTLPVTLSSFAATMTAESYVQLEWITQSESDMLGYHVQRSENDDPAQAIRLTVSPIEALNQSHENTYEYVDVEVEVDYTYYYWLESVEMDGSVQFFGPVSITIVEDDPEELPSVYEVTTLKGNYPNPFNPETSIQYSLGGTTGEAEPVSIVIYNTRGQKVRTLIDGPEEPGEDKIVVWNGTDDQGKPVSNGVYLYRLQTTDRSEVRKMLLMK